jgi:hypothetical protein
MNLKVGESIDEEPDEVNSGRQPALLNLEVERKAYLQHVKNLRLAHKIQMKNEKFITMTKLEQIITQKLEAYEDSITKVFQRIVAHVSYLKRKIDVQNKYIKNLFSFISKYEINMIQTLIQEGTQELMLPPPNIT